MIYDLFKLVFAAALKNDSKGGRNRLHINNQLMLTLDLVHLVSEGVFASLDGNKFVAT